MPDAAGFLMVMAALSASVQTFVEHVIKKNITWLDESKEGKADKRRQVTIHLIVFVVGAALAWYVELKPLTYLGVQQGLLPNSLMAGLLVSYGGSFFDETLGAIREFKKATEKVRKAGSPG